MITCPKCQKQLEDGTKFCDSCGEPIVETIFCPNCGNSTSAENAFCQVCGASLAAEPVAEPMAEPAPAYTAPAPAKSSKKLLVIGAAAAAAVVLIGVILAIVLGGGKPNYALYLKDKNLYYTSASKVKPMQVTDDLFGDMELENKDIANRADQYYSYAKVSSDGKTIFFPDEFDGNGTFTLYYRSTTSAKKEAKKIDSDVSGYQISDDGKTVVYKKDGNLYKHDLKDKTKIASDVLSYAISDNGKNIFWTNTDNNLYVKKGNKDKEKLDSDVTNGFTINEKGNTVWYEKNHTTVTDADGYTTVAAYDYYEHDLKEKKKIASDVYGRYGSVADDGEFYYTKKNDDETSLYDFLDSTDQLNEYVKEEVTNTTITTYKLFYYDGKGSKEISDSYYSWEDYSYETNAMVFTELGDDVKVSVEENDGAYSLLDKLGEAADYKVAVEATVSALDIEDVYDLAMTPEGDAIYYVTDVAEPQEGEEDYVPTGTIFKVEISGKKVKKAEKYADDVYAYSLYALENDVVVYYKDYKRGTSNEDGTSTPKTFTLYVNNEKVADDVNDIRGYDADEGTLLFETDYNNDADKRSFTLNYWNGKKVVKVSDDVYDCQYTPDGEVLYLKDYSLEKYKGELYIFSGKKSEKVDDDVVAIVPVYEED